MTFNLMSFLPLLSVVIFYLYLTYALLIRLEGIYVLPRVAYGLFVLFIALSLFPPEKSHFILYEKFAWLASRSVYEEALKIAICIALFKGLFLKEASIGVAIFCSVLAIYENISQSSAVYIEIFQYLSKEPPDLEPALYKINFETEQINGVVWYGFQIARFFVHYYLTYLGVLFWRNRNEFYLLIPLLTHALINMYIEYLDLWEQVAEIKIFCFLIVGGAIVLFLGSYVRKTEFKVIQ